MILESHFSWFRDNFVRSCWANPGLETNINIIPTLINPKFPNLGSFQFMRTYYNLPEEGVRYDVYSLGYVPQHVYRALTTRVGKWVNLTEFSELHKVILHLSYSESTFSGHYSKSYISRLSSGVTVMAIPHHSHRLRNHLRLSIRSSNDERPIETIQHETQLTSQNIISGWLHHYANDARREFKQWYVNGAAYETIMANMLAVGGYVTEFDDTGIAFVNKTNLIDIETYDKNSVNHYLVKLTDDTTNRFSSRLDSIFYLVNKTGEMKRLVLNPTDLVQITDNHVGISCDVVESILISLGWRMSDVALKVFSKENNVLQYYVNNENYLNSLNLLPEKLRYDALSGRVSAPTVLQAQWLHQNPLNLGIELPYHQLTKAKMDEFADISTWDSYINRPIVDATKYANDYSDLISYPGGSRVILTYKDGYVDEVTPLLKEEDDNILRLGHTNRTTIQRGNGARVDGMATPIVYSRLQDELTLLDLGKDYSIINDEIRVLNGLTDVYTLDLSSTYIETMDASLRLFDLPLVEFLPRIGQVTLVGDNRVLVPEIDYIIREGKVAIAYGMELTRLIFIFQPSLNAEDATMAWGFTHNGTIALDSSYLEVDPNNTHVVVDGKTYLLSEITWDVSYRLSTTMFPNAKPFILLKDKLSNADLTPPDLLAKRKVYEDNLKAISAFKDANLPPVEYGISTYYEQYPLMSIFMNVVVNEGLNGMYDYSPSAVAAFGLDGILSRYLYLIEDGLDVNVQGLEWNVIELLAHPHPDPMEVPLDFYQFLEKVNVKYFNSRIYLNRNFRITR